MSAALGVFLVGIGVYFLAIAIIYGVVGWIALGIFKKFVHWIMEK